jgi:hypothetical protein
MAAVPHQATASMALTDLFAVRRQLSKYPWLQDTPLPAGKLYTRLTRAVLKSRTYIQGGSVNGLPTRTPGRNLLTHLERLMHRSTLILLGSIGLAVACSKDDKAEPVDSGRDVAAYDAGWESFSLVPGVPNLDDDDGDGKPDWESSVADGDNEFAEFVLPAGLLANLTDGASVTLTLGGDTANIRVWQDGEIILPDGDSLTYEVPASTDALVFQVEFGTYLTMGELQVAEVGSDASEIKAAQVQLIGAPALTAHHLQDSLSAYALSVPGGGWYNNESFIDSFEEVFGERFTSLKGNKYGYDVWVQDEVEFATLSAPENVNDLVIDSIRDRGLDDFPEDLFSEPDYVIGVWGKGWATSQDSFGNFEATPPVTVDGVYYPYGRIYYGASGNYEPHKKMVRFLNQQLVQQPIEVDISWLCVGHVDEFATFIPDASSDKGFKLVYSDIDLGYDLIAGLDSDYALPLYGSGHHYDTVGDILADDALTALNEDLRDDYLLPILEQYTTEFGLEESDIIRIPALFEVAPGCGGYTAALIPGAANLVVDNYEGATTLLVADPFFRSDANDQTSDPVISDFLARMPAGIDVVFVDDWSVYHMGLGEVHCGSNTIRRPNTNWWEEAMPLLEVE